MAIDDLLYQQDPAQRAARAAATPRPAIDPRAASQVSRMRAADSAAAQATLDAQRAPPVRTPTGATQGIEDGVRSFGDSASRVARSPAVGATSRAASLARGAALSALPSIAIGSSIGSFARPTEDYYNRFGLDPRTVGQNGFKDLAARTGGVISDLGASVLDAGLAPVNFVRQFGGAAPLQTFSSIVQANDNPAPRQNSAAPGRGTTPQQPVTTGSSAGQPALGQQTARSPAQQRSSTQNQAPPGVYRRGNTFSDQPISHGVQFTPQRGGYVQAAPDDSQPSLTQRYQRLADDLAGARNVERARQAQAFAASTAAENQIAARNLLQNELRNARQRGLVPGSRFEAQLIGKLADITAQAPDKAFVQTPEEEDALTTSQRQRQLQTKQADQQGRQADQQTIAANLANQATSRQQQLLSQIDQLPGDADPSLRRSLVDRALLAQGKDPDAGRFQAIESVGGNDAFPIKTRSLYDTRTGRVIGGTGAVGQQAQPPAGFKQIGTSNGKPVYEDANGKRIIGN
ncbi:hypothetical protein [Solimonas marina]|uniref:Uncharacterized protein n=1 Tax=Solimonas marina TaxID=2714601 RepID=A0A969W7U0_9GAMM|nr:hypothetical protein [Solimonas marina]NKF21568.1 hypothetical protein [Solimonas marina]